MDETLVSIITPAYRCAHVVGETIQSVLDQTHTRWEMLIAEDCSPDDTRQVVEDWAARDSRIRLVPMSTNGGPALARNAAINAAQGRWLAFLDSDDLWLPTKLELSLAFAQQTGAAFVFTGFRRMSADGSKLGHYIRAPRELTYRKLLGNTAIATSTVMIDRKTVGPVSMRKTFYDDFDCWLRILKAGHVAKGLDEDLMRYRVMAQSVSRGKRRSASMVWRAYRELEGMSLPVAAWYFGQYAVRGMLKYSRL
jgi:teichuronic acid biosynthesis glycosyltransferase TuaG